MYSFMGGGTLFYPQPLGTVHGAKAQETFLKLLLKKRINCLAHSLAKKVMNV